MFHLTWLWNRKLNLAQGDDAVDMQNKKDLNLEDEHSIADTEGSHTIVTSDDVNEANTLEAVMEDNLDLMLEIILKVREDEEFAKSIYEDCPRLQALLDQNPDLRPLFEDPHYIRINFEQVYRNAGGVLPEDQPNIYYKAFKDGLIKVTQHPLFRVFRFLLLIKRMYTFLVDGFANLFKHIYISMFGIGALDAFNIFDGPNDVHRQNLYQAADRMEDPAVQEQMATLLESNPEDLDEAIEQDPELVALRDSSPLCAEMMSDPATFKILLDPDNLRALAECPDLIAADFADPDWMPPQVDEYHFDDAVQSEEEGIRAMFHDSIQASFGEVDAGGILDEIEGPQGAASNQQQHANKGKNGEQGGGGMTGVVGAGLLGYMTAQMGFSPSDMLMGGGGDELIPIEGLVDDTVQTTADAAADNAKTVADTAAEEAQTLSENAVMGVQYATDAAVTSCTEQQSQQANDAAYRCATTTATALAVGGIMMVGGGGGGGRKAAAMDADTNNEQENKENQNIEDDGKEDVDGNPKMSVRRFFSRNQ